MREEPNLVSNPQGRAPFATRCGDWLVVDEGADIEAVGIPKRTNHYRVESSVEDKPDHDLDRLPVIAAIIKPRLSCSVCLAGIPKHSWAPMFDQPAKVR